MREVILNIAKQKLKYPNIWMLKEENIFKCIELVYIYIQALSHQCNFMDLTNYSFSLWYFVYLCWIISQS